MRTSVLSSVLAMLALSACTSTSGVDALNVPRPSQEMTGSIARLPNPVVATEPQRLLPAPVMAAPQRAMLVPQPKAFEPEPEVQAPQPAIMSVPQPEAPAEVSPQEFASPAKPTVNATPFKGGKTYGPRFRDTHPISFGPVKPKQFSIHGVDVSRWQGNIDWAKLRSQGANFAYIKATDGGDHIDPMFRKNWNGAGAAGLKRGAYHFFYWCRTGGEQADWFIRNVPKSQNALPPVIDVEYNHQSSCKKRPSSETVIKKMQAFMDKLEAHYGQRPVIYTAPDFYKDHLQSAFPNHPFWLRSVAAHPAKRYPNRRWVFWQYSGTGLSHGVKGEIDLNVFNGDAAAWNRWLAKTSG